MRWKLLEFEHPRFFGKSWEHWKMSLIPKAERTQHRCVDGLKKFLEWADYTTESLFEEYLELSNSPDPRDKKLLKYKVVAFQRCCMDQGLLDPRTNKVKKKKSGTVDNYYKAILSFFKANEIKDFKIEASERVKKVSKPIEIIQKDELRKMLSLCGSVRSKAMIHLLKESGMRISDLVLMEIDTFRNFIEGNQEWFTWEFEPFKTRGSNLFANPVIGRESREWLKLWMIERDKINDRRERMGLAPTQWVFSLVENYRGREVGEQLISDTVSIMFRELAKKAGLKKSIHSLRKYHKTNLEYSGVPTSWINKMQGRAGEGTGGLYTRPNPKQLIEMYRKGYSALAVSEVVNVERMDSLEAENEQLKRRVDFVVNQLRTVETMKEQLEIALDTIKTNPELITNPDFFPENQPTNPWVKPKP